MMEDNRSISKNESRSKWVRRKKAGCSQSLALGQ